MGLSGGVASLFTYPYVRDADWFAAGIPPYGNLCEYQRKQDTMANLPQALPQAWRPPMGWNSWDSYGTTLTEDELLANARFMAEHLKNVGWDTLVIDIDWYDPTARAHGYNDNAPLILDEYGCQLPDPVRFPSAAGGKGFGPLAAAVHELGLKLGVHMMRGIPRIAVDKNLPVYGTSYTAKDVADPDHVCKWNPDNYGLNQSHPGAQAWYDAQLDLFASWGLDFLKVDDMQTPFHSDEIAAYHRAIAKAEAKYGRSIDLSLSPGGRVATSYVDFLRENAQMWRISDDLWDRWEDIYQQFARLARWAPFQNTGHWADADMVPFGHIGLRAERGAGDPDRGHVQLHGQLERPALAVDHDLQAGDPHHHRRSGHADRSRFVRHAVRRGDGRRADLRPAVAHRVLLRAEALRRRHRDDRHEVNGARGPGGLACVWLGRFGLWLAGLAAAG